jgi:hypothetical protein
MITTESPQKQRETHGFSGALVAPGRSPEIPEALDVFGWFVGDWELEVKVYWVDVSARHLTGEVHASRVLEGRAVQDVWIMPRRSERTAEPERTCNMYGSTLRMWDPAIQAWRVRWTNPVTARGNELIARWQGKDIVQLGTHPDGTPIRWIFSEITADSFRWTGESLQADGKTWNLEGEFYGRRMK